MKSLISILILCSLIFYSCGSGAYDLEPVQQERKDTIAGKPEARPEESQFPPIESTGKNVPDKGPFVIQIGAFVLESNALKQVESAKNVFGEAARYKLENGLFKVQVGEFSTMPETLAAIEKARKSGFTDAFILQK